MKCKNVWFIVIVVVVIIAFIPISRILDARCREGQKAINDSVKRAYVLWGKVHGSRLTFQEWVEYKQLDFHVTYDGTTNFCSAPDPME